MISEIIIAISRRLNERYPEATINTERVEQGLQEPCFFIEVLEPIRTPLIGQRWQQDTLFDIQLFDSEAENIQFYTIAEELFAYLEYITLPDGNMLRGTSMHFAVNDGVLHFFVTYTVFLYRKKEKERYKEEKSVNTVWEGLRFQTGQKTDRRSR